MNSFNGLPYLLWGIAIALPAWYLIHRRWVGMHRKDELIRKHHGYTYVPPSTECKTIERF